ncbi:MAG: MATE family efflux transporter [Bdellovibrionota bacterium]
MAASAGYQIAARSFMFFLLPVWGMSNAAATLVGQNLGAKQIERAETSVMVTVKYSLFVMAAVTAIFVGIPNLIIRIFTQEPEIVAYGTLALRIFGSCFIFLGIGMVLTQALNGAGDTKTPTWINFLALWVFEAPFAYTMALGLGFGFTGVLIALPVSQFLFAILAYYYFKRGKWKQVKV